MIYIQMNILKQEIPIGMIYNLLITNTETPKVLFFKIQAKQFKYLNKTLEFPLLLLIDTAPIFE